MKVLILGVGDAFTKLSFGSSAVIAAPQGFVLIDCPDLIHRAMHEACASSGWTVDALQTDDIILTHLHGDHCNGLESLGFMRRVRSLTDPAVRPARLHTTAAVADRLWERLGPAMDAGFGTSSGSTLDDYFDVHLLEPGGAARVAGLTVQCRMTHHPVPTIGLLVSDGDATLGWSGDTAFEAEHVAWLAAADLIVHECNLGAAHTPIAALQALPDEIRARMRLIHLPDEFDRSVTDIAPLRAGEVLTV